MSNDNGKGLESARSILLRKHLAEGPKPPAIQQQFPLLDMPEPAAPPETGKAVTKRDREIVNPEIFTNSGLIRAEDIVYMPTILLQCFMPVRHNEKNKLRWETGNRDAKLVIRAGELVKPNDPGTFKQCVVPAGPKARIVNAYIADYAYRERSPEIDLSESMRAFMAEAGIPIGGKNGKELQRELENVAASDMYFGFWTPGVSAGQRKAPVCDEFSFWIDKNPKQATIWKQKMVLSPRYFNAIMEGQHIAPIYWPALRNLQHSARAMDIFCFMSYRLRTIPFNKPLPLNAETLHAMFGRDIKELRHFWPRFLTALKEAADQYQTARFEILNDAVRFWYSAPIIPHKKVGRIIASV